MKFTLFRDCDVPKVEKDFGEDIIDGSPRQHVQLLSSAENDSIRSGIWECTAGVFRAVMKDQVEFCHILEGGATIRASDGKTYTVREGDAFVMESGLELEWTVDDYVKKHFVISAAK